MEEDSAKGVYYNAGFDETFLEVKAENGVELKERTSSNSDATVKLKTGQSADKKNKLEIENFKSENKSENVIVNSILKCRHFLNKLFFGKTLANKIFWIIAVNSVAVAILIASVLEHVWKGSPPIDWCNDVGFLWILFILVYLEISYSFVNRFFGKRISHCFGPVRLGWTYVVSKRYIQWLCFCAPFLGLAAFVIIFPGKSGRRVFSFLGMIVFIIFGFLFSKYPGHIRWRPVIMGMVLQFAFGLFTIRFETGKNILNCIGNKVTRFFQYTEEGASFMYGYLGKPDSKSPPIFAFTVLPVIFFLSFFLNILSYYGALQWFIMKVSRVVKVAMGTTVCESVNAVASIFLGMTEAPLLIRNYFNELTKSEICAILCAGWSTVAGVVLAAYIKFGVKASHLIAASVMSAPASLSFSKLFYPETEESKTTTDNIVLSREEATNALDAASKGALAALAIVAGITANIIAFLAFIAFVDGGLSWLGLLIGIEELSFRFVMSKLFYPVSFLMGIDEDSIEDVAYLVGVKTVVNEFEAYKKLGEFIRQNKLSERTEIIATYALCGFSNFSSIGITIGAFSSIEPRRLAAITEVALPAFISANIVCFMTACVAGCLIE